MRWRAWCHSRRFGPRASQYSPSYTISARRTLAFSTVTRDIFRRPRSSLAIQHDGTNSAFDMLDSFGPPTDFLLAVALAHHGEPPDLTNPGQDDRKWWTDGGRDPLATVKLLVALARGPRGSILDADPPT
jgi:hypothetical protein